ncbi:MAG: spore coat associated protein CotJA, partial [Oscillospiraceae bacterium]|nr:spore coat associated protein CotJA [Oscillospiraceae bacterium]
RTYEPAVALKRGTIFPSLDLPFLGGAEDDVWK